MYNMASPGVWEHLYINSVRYGRVSGMVGQVILNSLGAALFPLPVSYGQCYRFL